MPVFNRQYIFHPGNCINAKKTFASACRRCIMACPHSAISETKGIDEAKCTECGVCMAVCPSDGFTDRAFAELSEHILQADDVILNCPAAQPLGYEINCMGLFDHDAWSALLLLSGHKGVRIVTGDCGVCEDTQACAAGAGALKDVLERWTLPNNIKIEIVPWDDQEVTEPDVFQPGGQDSLGEMREKGLLWEISKKKMKSMMPAAMLAEETTHITETRLLLLAGMKKAPEQRVPFRALKINEKCTACGFCARVCPQGALSHVKQDDGVEHFIYQPFLCVHCQRCIKICGPQAVGMENMELNLRFMQGKILLHKLVPRLCDTCGCQIYHRLDPGLCITCAKKVPELKGILY